MAQVNKSTMIGELLQIDQNIAPILLNIGMHCLEIGSKRPRLVLSKHYYKKGIGKLPVPFLFARRLFDSFIILPES